MSKSRKNKTWDLGNIEISHKRGVKGISRIKVRGELWMICTRGLEPRLQREDFQEKDEIYRI